MSRLLTCGLAAVACGTLAGCWPRPPEPDPFEAFIARRGLSTEEFCRGWHESEDKYGGFDGAALALPLTWLTIVDDHPDLDFGPAEVIQFAADHCVAD